MEIIQISVFIENKPGQMCRVVKLLSDNGIDMISLNLAETSDYGLLRLIVDDHEKACAILKDNGFLFTSNPVVCVEIPGVVGALAKLLDIITGIDIEYMYSFSVYRRENAFMAFKAKNVGEIRSAFDRSGIRVVGAEDIG